MVAVLYFVSAVLITFDSPVWNRWTVPYGAREFFKFFFFGCYHKTNIDEDEYVEHLEKSFAIIEIRMKSKKKTKNNFKC